MKRGEMTITEISGLILSIAVVLILLTLVARLFIPFFNEGDETAKSYFENLEGEIKVADKGGVGEFFMFYLGDSDKEYYLVYFGDLLRVDFSKDVLNDAVVATDVIVAGYSGGAATTNTPKYVEQSVPFNSLGKNKNRICVCYLEASQDDDYESTCKYCEDLDYPVEFAEKNSPTWYQEAGKTIKIELKEDKYVFTKI